MTSGQTKTRLVFFGNERLVSGLKSTDTPILRGLVERGYEIGAIVANHSDARSRNNRPLEVQRVAEEHNIPLLTPVKPTEIMDYLVDLKADAAVLVAYGRIVPKKIIDIFPKGIINVHPSLLPKYRGPTPLESPILAGDPKTGVSIMQLAVEMDAGPVYAQTEFSIAPTDTKFDLYDKAIACSADLLFEKLPVILDGSLVATPQDESQATYCSLLSKEDGVLDPATQTAEEAERRIRAFLGFPKTRLNVLDRELIITKAHVSDQQKTPLDVMFLGGQYLSIDELIAPSGKTMSAEAYLRGYAA